MGVRILSARVSPALQRCWVYRSKTVPVAGIPAGDRFAQRAGDNKIQVLLKAINEQIATHAVIFDVSTDRGIRSGNQSLTEIMYGLFLQSLGYAKDLDLSELEITLEEKEQLEGFEAEYGRLFNKEWSYRERQSRLSRSARRAEFSIASIPRHTRWPTHG